MDKYIETPLTKDKVKDLHAGDYVYISGTIYTARDAAHKIGRASCRERV